MVPFTWSASVSTLGLLKPCQLAGTALLLPHVPPASTCNPAVPLNWLPENAIEQESVAMHVAVALNTPAVSNIPTSTLK
jgi:hypothetical protein